MKTAKKLFAVLFAVVMVLSVMAVPAFAAGTNSIKVTGAQKDETYSIYKMLDLSVNAGMTAYSYTVNSNWTTFFTTGAGKDYVDIDGSGYVTWKAAKNTPADIEAFGKAAAKFAADNSISTAATDITPDTDGDITFSGLDSGYYLITSTNGTLAIVDTTPTNPAATVNEKNADATIEKKVQEDSDDSWGTTNGANIGQDVNFQITIHAKKGAENYVLTDTLPTGLTLKTGTIAVKVGSTDLTKDTDYTLVTSDHSIEITFKQTYLDAISGDTDIVVTYTATLNENAAISTDGNKNSAQLKFGDASSTTEAETTTYTYKFDIIKTDSSLKVLAGAKFELYDAATDGNKINLVKVSDGLYRVATPTEVAGVGFVSAVIEAGRATVQGLDNNTTYWLEETEQPEGYNKLAARQEVKIEATNLTTTMTGDTWAVGNGGVQITNNAGTELPSTGGIGTTIFYVVGGVLVVAAVVLLVTKKRMSGEK